MSVKNEKTLLIKKIKMNFKWDSISNDELKWIGVDFDGVIARPSLAPNYEIQPIQDGAVQALEEMVKMGLKPSIFTSRHSSDYRNLERYSEYYSLPIRRIETGKPLYRHQIDDRAIEFDPLRPELSYERAMQIITTGKLPW